MHKSHGDVTGKCGDLKQFTAIANARQGDEQHKAAEHGGVSWKHVVSTYEVISMQLLHKN